MGFYPQKELLHLYKFWFLFNCLLYVYNRWLSRVSLLQIQNNFFCSLSAVICHSKLFWVKNVTNKVSRSIHWVWGHFFAATGYHLLCQWEANWGFLSGWRRNFKVKKCLMCIGYIKSWNMGLHFYCPPCYCYKKATPFFFLTYNICYYLYDIFDHCHWQFDSSKICAFIKCLHILTVWQLLFPWCHSCQIS